MIRDLNRYKKTDWQEKIQLELTLSDLQVLYDAIGALPPKYLKIKHKNTPFHNEEVYYNRKVYELYEDLDYIIMEYNGINDDDMTVNNSVELKLIGDEYE